MKNTLIFLLLFGSSTAFGQTIGFSGGIVMSTFSLISPQTDITESYASGGGTMFECSIHEKTYSNFTYRLALNYNRITGFVRLQNENVYTESLDIFLDKRIIGISVYPIGYRFANKLSVSLGAELNYLFINRTTGTSRFSGKSWSFNWESEHPYNSLINNVFNVGLKLRFDAPIRISENLDFVPSTQLYYSLTDEFKDILLPASPNIFRIGLSLGFYWKLKGRD